MKANPKKSQDKPASSDGTRLVWPPDVAGPIRITDTVDNCVMQGARNTRSALHPLGVQPQMRMAKSVHRQIMFSIGSLWPETGGILLGPIESDDITHYYFDRKASCSSVTYSPDHVTLKRKMTQEWMPSGIDMKGFVHSHPGLLDRPSAGDMTYIQRLLVINPDMAVFAAPIVIPWEYRFCPFVVLRDDPSRPRRAKLVLF